MASNPAVKSSTILVLGGAHIDRRGRISGETIPGASNPGRVILEPGGSGFNAARNLALLGYPTQMISVRGGDRDGDMIAESALQYGVQDQAITFLDRQTASYTAILAQDGGLLIALADMDLYSLFSPRRLKSRTVRQAIAKADFILCDTNLPEDTLVTIAGVERTQKPRIAALGVSPAKIVRLRPCLSAFDMVFMNESEAISLCDETPSSPEAWPLILRELGLRAGVITRGRNALIAFDEQGACTFLPVPSDAVSDVTGAGDALAAGTIAATLDGQPFFTAIRQGIALATMTVGHVSAVLPELDRIALETMVGLVPEPAILA